MKSSTRVDILLEKEQVVLLKKLSREQDKSVSELIRDAVERHYARPGKEQKLDSVGKLSALKAPVSSWKQMEKEILKGRLG